MYGTPPIRIRFDGFFGSLAGLTRGPPFVPSRTRRVRFASPCANAGRKGSASAAARKRLRVFMPSIIMASSPPRPGRGGRRSLKLLPEAEGQARGAQRLAAFERLEQLRPGEARLQLVRRERGG